MGIVLRFPRHAGASAGSAGSDAARASNVMCEQPLSPASFTRAAQRLGGMPRARQVLTVDAGRPSPADTAPVPPRSSIAVSGVSMAANIVRNLRTCQEFANCEATFFEGIASIEVMADALTRQAKRLEATRIACGKTTQREFYTAIRVGKGAWSDFETGKRPLTLGVARKIKIRFGLPLDWSLDGDPRALDLAPAAVADKLKAFAA